ncbi:MAG: acetyl-CoA carboxylase carboxyltransferase subunit alpha [Dissulfurispiraceae bacterium]|jgi:acetyl-CoA carboxylase carboxyl transferase subunit alpha|nr:acetyl-CoA carboxylase carboxyltransferase subunit alpha [Dissulfurispiraceae bacterium]
MNYYLDFEKPLEELERRIEDLKKLSDTSEINIDAEIKKLEKKADDLRSDLFADLTPWQKTLIARHPERPYTIDYINMMVDEFIELHGDRRFADDAAIVGGVGKLRGIPVVIIGHQKGRGTKERIQRNFGQPNPEGYRKALRLMQLAERFKKPIVTLIDTPGAYPGIGAEERGQAEAIALNLQEMSKLNTPIISVVIGEGGSGGALGLSVADRLYMLEHSVYSVISPEGCAAILWKRNGTAVGAAEYEKAASALKITAQDLKSFKIIDDIIPEPLGGAHRDPKLTAENISEHIVKAIETIGCKSCARLIDERYKRLRRMGSITELETA